jgi:hypothetical protein
MLLSPLALSLAGVVLLALLAAFAFRTWRSRSGTSARGTARGPGNLHFVCAGCTGQFTHTKRTVAAWERGTRRFFCNSCHKSWREAQPPQSEQGSQSFHGAPVSANARTVRGGRSVGLAPARSGCLSVVIVAFVLPVAAYVVARYA